MRLNELMRKKGYSFSDLAKASGVTKTTLERIVYGQAKEPHPSTKRKIAAVFGLEIDQIDDFAELTHIEKDYTTQTDYPPLTEVASKEEIAAVLKAFEEAEKDEESGTSQEEVERRIATLIAGYKEQVAS
jgi:transcriptional regulator with XRE-family HTH domain